MIHKDWQPSFYLRQLKALYRRLPPSHPKYPQIKDELGRYNAGFKGEESIKYQLSMLETDKYHIFHDIRLPVGDYFFQIDVLVISLNMILIIEVKNIAGTLFFDHIFHQLIRTHDGKEDGFPDPILQLSRQQSLLYKWLENQHYTNDIPPIIPLLTVSNPQAIIKSSSKEHQNIILHRNYLPIKIQQLQNKHSGNYLSSKETKKLSKRIISHHSPYKPDILSRFQLHAGELLKGVHCPECGHVLLLYRKAKWHCPSCAADRDQALYRSLEDYTLLVAETITNQQLREFLHIRTTAQASRILKQFAKPTAKRTTYSLSSFTES